MIIEYGDFEVSCNGLTFSFKPSFYNISKIGTSKEIIDCLFTLHYSDSSEWLSSFQHVSSSIAKKISDYAQQKAIAAAVLVLKSCCEDDIAAFTGDYYFGKKVRYKPGFERPEVLIELARHLLKHGVLGVSKKKSTNSKSGKITEFVATYHASVAMNYLGFNRDDAWNMSMTELLHHLEVRSPDSEDQAEAKQLHNKEKLRECADLRARIKGQRNG